VKGPALRGVVTIDLSGHVDRYGMITRDGSHQAWKALAAAPAGIFVRLHIGPMRGPPGELLGNLQQAGILEAAEVEVTGTDPEGIAQVLAGVAALRG
jgi:hypothetical protein